MQPIDPLAGNDIRADARLKGQLREYRQLVGGVGAIDVQGRVSLSVAQSLRLPEGLLVIQGRSAHLGEDEVASAVDDGRDTLNLIRRQRESEGLDDRDSAANASLEGDRAPRGPRLGKYLCPVLGQKCLVGRNDVLARR